MKARIKRTGEIVNIAEYAKIALEICDPWGNTIELRPDEVELIQEPTEDEHWQDIRERAAIAAMQGLLCAPSYEADRDKLNMIATDAVSIADALIEELKKK